MLSSLRHVRVSTIDDVVIAELDVADRTMNVIDASVLSDLSRVVEAVLAGPAIRGMVLGSAKVGSFGGGADLTTLPKLADDPHTPEFLARTHALMLRMVRADKPLIAAIDGYALGGALEVAMGCRALVATADAVLGLPEATLGLIPGGGGTQLALRHLAPALAAELMVSGRTLTARQAFGAGLVAEIANRDELVERAVARVLHQEPVAELLFDSATASAHWAEVQASVAAIRRPPSAAARAAILDAVKTGLFQGAEAGLAVERQEFITRLRSQESGALIHLFHAETAAKRRFRAVKTRPTRIGVVGAGQMGAGIAATAVSHGVDAVVRDIDAARLDEAEQRAGTEGGASWVGTTAWDGFESADVAVEAVFELPELKRETLEKLSQVVGAHTLITTNTSAIPVASLADAVRRPAEFLGTHFFSPVEKMPLVELVPHQGTSDEALDAAGSMARCLGKVPIVVADYPGFFTSRVYARWLIEGLRLLIDGAEPADVEAAARTIGFPVGPLQACDEVTLELVRQASVTQVAERVFLSRFDVGEVKSALSRLIDAGHQGRRFGQGFYRYIDGRRDGLDSRVAPLIASPSHGPAPDVQRCGERLLLAFVTESLLCWDDATLCHPDDGDVASVLGIGFPRALGGPFRWADRIGAANLVRRCHDLADSAAFPVSAATERLAKSGGLFAEEARIQRPGV